MKINFEMIFEFFCYAIVLAAGTIIVSTAMAKAPNTNSINFNLEVSKGNIAGHEAISITGLNTDMDSAAEEDVVEFGDQYDFWPSSAETLEVVSSSADDAASGTGVRSVLVKGLDASYSEIQETITLSGATPAASSNDFLRVNSMAAESVGSGLDAAGNIELRVSGDGTTAAYISAGSNASKFARYSLPAGKDAYLIDFLVSSSDTAGSSFGSVCKFQKRNEGKGFQDVSRIALYSQESDKKELDIPIKVEKKSDIRVRCEQQNDNLIGNVFFNMILFESGS